MALKRGDNVNNPNLLYVVTSGAEEFDAFEALGPCMQQVLRDGPFKSSSVAILEQVEAKNDQIMAQNQQRVLDGLPPVRLLDPKNPQLDMYLARGFLQLNFTNLLKDRSEEDAKLGVTPIVSRPSPHSMREQRKSKRRARW